MDLHQEPSSRTFFIKDFHQQGLLPSSQTFSIKNFHTWDTIKGPEDDDMFFAVDMVHVGEGHSIPKRTEVTNFALRLFGGQHCSRCAKHIAPHSAQAARSLNAGHIREIGVNVSKENWRVSANFHVSLAYSVHSSNQTIQSTSSRTRLRMRNSQTMKRAMIAMLGPPIVASILIRALLRRTMRSCTRLGSPTPDHRLSLNLGSEHLLDPRRQHSIILVRHDSIKFRANLLSEFEYYLAMRFPDHSRRKLMNAMHNGYALVFLHPRLQEAYAYYNSRS
jgi:hypothetical protein